MDDALKAEWYDVAEADRKGFLDWLHGSHLPKLQARPGILWVGHYAITPRRQSKDFAGLPKMHTDDPTVAPGSDFVLLQAAASPDVFLDPHAPPEDPRNKMHFARRTNYRQAIFIVEARVNGPEYRSLMPGSGPAPAMQLGNFNVKTTEDEFELGVYYRRSRYAQIPGTRGCIGMRKLVSVAGWSKHGVLYEFTTMEDHEEDFEPRFREAAQGSSREGRSLREYVVHAPKAPHAGRLIWPAA